MKLLSKLTLFITLSKLLIVVLFVLLLPSLVKRVSFQYTNYYLGEQKKKVIATINKNGADYYLQGDSAYASYTLLKEEYVSLFPATALQVRDTIETTQRIVESDTLNYRLLRHPIKLNNKNYLLEIGKTTATIGQYNNLLQRFTLYVLIGLIIISILADLVYTHLLLKPLDKIVTSKLLNRKFPFKESLTPVKTSTSDFKYLDQSLINLMEKIQEAFEKEREFTSNASHELMTPISILQTNIENMLVDESLTEQQLQQITGLMKTLHRLKKIVHSLLYISRIENEQFTKSDTVNVSEQVSAVMDELDNRLEVANIVFTNFILTPVKIKGVNEDLFFQLLYNLINNAIRYNKTNGTIEISDRFEPGLSYEILIKDTGCGIPAEDIERIFNRFKKSNNNNRGEGFGLGLSIVKSIATYHGFTIKVISQLGAGSTFSIVIPVDMVG